MLYMYVHRCSKKCFDIISTCNMSFFLKYDYHTLTIFKLLLHIIKYDNDIDNTKSLKMITL